MGISKKGKRRIVVNARAYLWWVFNEYDQTEFDGIQVMIVAEDQRFYIKYGLQQRPEARYLVIGFQHDAGKIHVLCPAFERDARIITPSGISGLIKWSSQGPVESDSPAITHAWSGKDGILDERQARSLYQDMLNEMKKQV